MQNNAVAQLNAARTRAQVTYVVQCANNECVCFTLNTTHCSAAHVQYVLNTVARVRFFNKCASTIFDVLTLDYCIACSIDDGDASTVAAQYSNAQVFKLRKNSA